MKNEHFDSPFEIELLLVASNVEYVSRIIRRGLTGTAIKRKHRKKKN